MENEGLANWETMSKAHQLDLTSCPSSFASYIQFFCCLEVGWLILGVVNRHVASLFL